MRKCQLKCQVHLQTKALNIINDNGPCDIVFLAARLDMQVAYSVVHIVHPLIYADKIRLTPKGYKYISSKP